MKQNPSYSNVDWWAIVRTVAQVPLFLALITVQIYCFLESYDPTRVISKK
jgi:hypothetical protein